MRTDGRHRGCRGRTGARSPASRGFTLLELLVTLSITSIIAVFLVSTFRSGTAVLKRTYDDVNADMQVKLVQERLNAWLSRAYPLDPTRSPLNTVFPLDGDPGEIRFSAPLYTAPGQNDLYRIRIWHDAPNAALKMNYQVDRNELPDTSFSADNVLLDGVTAVNFQYLSVDHNAHTSTWNADWQGQAALPQAVRISATLTDQRTWPDIIVRPVITGRTQCVFDPVVRQCR